MTSSRFSRYTAVAALAVAVVLAAPGRQVSADIVPDDGFSTMVRINFDPFPFGWQSGALAVADFDGDSLIDAAVPGGLYGAVCVIANDTTQTWLPAGLTPVALAALDYDDDGDTDLVVAVRDGGGVTLLVNDGAGNFTRDAFIATGPAGTAVGPSDIEVADLDQDGWIDLVVANRWAETVVVLRGTALGFTLCQTVPVAFEPTSLALGDFDGNGWVDVAVACAADDSVKILTNNCGVLSPAGTFEGGPYPVAIAAGDLNGDGDIDLAVANGEAAQVMLLLNDGAATFAPMAIALQNGGRDVQIVDIDFDGRLDIRCGGQVLRNLGDWNFQIGGVEAGYGHVYASGELPGQPGIFLGTTSGSTVTVMPHVPPAPTVVGDVNGDGVVNAIDLLRLAGCFNSSDGDSRYDPACDFNGDGAVNALDLLILAREWGA